MFPATRSMCVLPTIALSAEGRFMEYCKLIYWDPWFWLTSLVSSLLFFTPGQIDLELSNRFSHIFNLEYLSRNREVSKLTVTSSCSGNQSNDFDWVKYSNRWMTTWANQSDVKVIQYRWNKIERLRRIEKNHNGDTVHLNINKKTENFSRNKSKSCRAICVVA